MSGGRKAGSESWLLLLTWRHPQTGAYLTQNKTEPAEGPDQRGPPQGHRSEASPVDYGGSVPQGHSGTQFCSAYSLEGCPPPVVVAAHHHHALHPRTWKVGEKTWRGSSVLVRKRIKTSHIQSLVSWILAGWSKKGFLTPIMLKACRNQTDMCWRFNSPLMTLNTLWPWTRFFSVFWFPHCKIRTTIVLIPLAYQWRREITLIIIVKWVTREGIQHSTWHRANIQ